MATVSKLPPAPEAIEHRNGQRYGMKERVDIVLHGKSVCSGELVDISRTGAAFRTHDPIKVGSQYSFVITDIGELTGTVIRAFDRNGIGVRFDIDSYASSRLEQRLEILLSEVDIVDDLAG